MGAYTSQTLVQFTPPGHNVAVNFAAARQKFIQEQKSVARALAFHGFANAAREKREFAQRVSDTTERVQQQHQRR